MLTKESKKIIRDYSGDIYRNMEKKNPQVRVLIETLGLKLDYLEMGKQMLKEDQPKEITKDEAKS